VASGCSEASDKSTASGGDCVPDKKDKDQKDKDKDKDKKHRKDKKHPVAEKRPEADRNVEVGVGGGAAEGLRTLARTGLATSQMVLASALAMLLGTLLLVLGTLDRRRKVDS
jgi:hypothetical protein